LLPKVQIHIIMYTIVHQEDLQPQERQVANCQCRTSIKKAA
jgi:hypothetical protein